MTAAPAIEAFLSLIGWAEGADYSTIVTGVDGPHTFTDFSDHPFAPQFNRTPVIVRRVPLLQSTAAGRYQLLYRYWVPYRKQLGLVDYSPASQDAVALQQMKERGAILHLTTGDIQGAIVACRSIWASLPGNDYHQGGKTMGELLEKYKELNS